MSPMVQFHSSTLSLLSYRAMFVLKINPMFVLKIKPQLSRVLVKGLIEAFQAKM